MTYVRDCQNLAESPSIESINPGTQVPCGPCFTTVHQDWGFVSCKPYFGIQSDEDHLARKKLNNELLM